MENKDYVLNINNNARVSYHLEANRRKTIITLDISIEIDIIDIDTYYAHGNLGYNRLRLTNLCSEKSRYPESELVEWATELGLTTDDKTRKKICDDIREHINM